MKLTSVGSDFVKKVKCTGGGGGYDTSLDRSPSQSAQT